MYRIIVIKYVNDYYNSHFGQIMIKRQRVYSKHTQDTMTLMGQYIKLYRKKKSWTENDLAKRAGISRATLQKIEKGDVSCSIGLVFEVATLVGVPLFEQKNPSLSEHIERLKDKLVLLPRRIRDKVKVDDNF